MRVQKLLVSMDSLMDTRLACVHLLNHKWASKLLHSGYVTRTHNKLSLLATDIIDKVVDDLYAVRDTPVLQVARPTNVLNLLSERIIESRLLQDKHPESKEVKIVLNTYPYTLTKDEVYNFVKGFSDILQTENITRVHLPTKELTPQYLLPRYSGYITHDLNEWVRVHEVNVNKLKMPLFTITCPGYISDMDKFIDMLNVSSKKLDEKTMQKYLQYGLDALKRNLAPYVELDFLPLSDFSVTPIFHNHHSRETTNEGQ